MRYIVVLYLKIHPMRISFDFDDTLSRDDVQEFASYLIAENVADVYVVTCRFCDQRKHEWLTNPTNDDFWEVIDRVGIDKGKVHFTNFEPKYPVLFDLDIAIHVDDDMD